MVSLTCRPRMPPWAFTSLAHSWYPLSNAWPSAEKSPVRDSDAPMVMGLVVALPAGAGLLLEPLALVQAARTLSPSTATAVVAIAFVENRGRTGIAPSSSFLPFGIRRVRAAGHGRILVSAGYTGRNRSLPVKCDEICLRACS